MKCLSPNHCRMGIEDLSQDFCHPQSHVEDNGLTNIYKDGCTFWGWLECSWSLLSQHELLFQFFSSQLFWKKKCLRPHMWFFFLALLSLNLISTLFLKPYYILLILGHNRVNTLVKPKMLPLVWLMVFMQHSLWSMSRKIAPTNWSTNFLELQWTHQTRFNI
jgi:hypothetical protein